MTEKQKERTWKNPEEPPHNVYYFINHLEPQKRLRVWGEQHMNAVIESLKPSNYLTEFVRFMKGCDSISRCYPNHEELGHVDEIRFEFWSRYQAKVKTVIKPLIKKMIKDEIKKDLVRMRFHD